MRFFSRIFDNGHTRCFYGCEHCIYRCADSYHIEIYLRADKVFCLDIDHTVVKCALCAEGSKSFEVLVDRPVAEVAAARHSNSCAPEFAEERSEKIIGRSHVLCHFIRNNRLCDARCIDPYGIFIKELNICAHFDEYAQADGNIAYLRNIFEYTRLVRKNNSRDNCNGSVLRAAYLNLSVKGPAALYNKLLQVFSLPFLPNI